MHSDNNHSLVSAIYPGSKVHIYLLKDSEALGGSDNVGVDHKCLSSDECSTWLRYDNVPYNLMSKLDIMLDGTDNAAEGKFRYNQRTDDETLSRMFLKINKQF